LRQVRASLSPSPLQNLLPSIAAPTARAVSFTGRYDPFGKPSGNGRSLREADGPIVELKADFHSDGRG
jgi:hypothetical protein